MQTQPRKLIPKEHLSVSVCLRSSDGLLSKPEYVAAAGISTHPLTSLGEHQIPCSPSDLKCNWGQTPSFWLSWGLTACCPSPWPYWASCAHVCHDWLPESPSQWVSKPLWGSRFGFFSFILLVRCSVAQSHPNYNMYREHQKQQDSSLEELLFNTNQH